jgi:hypothetical protein
MHRIVNLEAEDWFRMSCPQHMWVDLLVLETLIFPWCTNMEPWIREIRDWKNRVWRWVAVL